MANQQLYLDLFAICIIIVTVLAAGTALVWGMGRLGQLVEGPGQRLGRYLFPDDEEDDDGNG